MDRISCRCSRLQRNSQSQRPVICRLMLARPPALLLRRLTERHTHTRLPAIGRRARRDSVAAVERERTQVQMVMGKSLLLATPPTPCRTSQSVSKHDIRRLGQ